MFGNDLNPACGKSNCLAQVGISKWEIVDGGCAGRVSLLMLKLCARPLTLALFPLAERGDLFRICSTD